MARVESVVYPRRERVEDRRKESDDRKLLDQFFDHSTLLAISRLTGQGLIEAIDFPIAMGKEGGVFRAHLGEELRAVKIYRINNTTFRNLPAYALEELRRESSIRNFAGLISAWTRRENTILTRLQDAGVTVPAPIGHFRNVLVMGFIGDAEGAAPRLKDTPIDDPAALYEDLVAEIGRMIRRAKLVHGDLSPYNTLWFEGKVVVIDVAQAVPCDHPNALKLLERDIDNFTKYLGRTGFVVDSEDFLKAVGGDTVGPPPRE